MKEKMRITSILMIVLLSMCLSTSCIFIGDNFRARELISYLNKYKEGDEKVQFANIYDKPAQKSMEIFIVNVDTVKEADEVIRLINQYLEDHPDYFLNDDYYIEVHMDYSERSHTQNFICRNSMEIYWIGYEEDDENYDATVIVEDRLCYLQVIGYNMDRDEKKISCYSGLFSDIKELVLNRTYLDDMSAFGTMESLERVAIYYEVGQISEETLAQLSEMYPEIEFVG